MHAEKRQHHIPAQYVPSDTRQRAPGLVSPPTSQLFGVDVSVAGLWPSYTVWSCVQSDGWTATGWWSETAEKTAGLSVQRSPVHAVAGTSSTTTSWRHHLWYNCDRQQHDGKCKFLIGYEQCNKVNIKDTKLLCGHSFSVTITFTNCLTNIRSFLKHVYLCNVGWFYYTFF